MSISKTLAQTALFPRAIAFLLILLLCEAGLPCDPAFSNEASFSQEDLSLLSKIQKDTFQYFIRLSDKNTGLTRDSSQPGAPASIAATGFSLAAFAIAQSHGWVEPEYAQKYLEKTLKTLLNKAAHKNGFFYHFLDSKSGKRVWDSEASSIDTALLVAGALLAGQMNPGTPIEAMAQKIYSRIDWAWMMNGSDFVCMGWRPESGFLPYYWDTYSELMILLALAIGAPENPIPPGAWERWMRHEAVYNNKRIVYSPSGSLFTYQFSHAYIDFRNLWDEDRNYFENSKLATLANREYSLSARYEFKGYSEKSWGLSASLGPGGYKNYGGKPGEGLHDGTVAPYASLSSIIFSPDFSMNAVRFFYENYGDQLYGPFGFRDAFNLNKNWWAAEYIGIDQGITLLMLENFLQNGIIWKKFMALKSIQKWVGLAKLKIEGVGVSTDQNLITPAS